jgi:cytochrome P450 family 110
MAQSSLPEGPRFRHSPQAWSFISKPRQFYAWLRSRYGEVATIRAASAPLVMALTAEGARQVLTRDPDAYDAFHKAAFTGMAGRGSLWVQAGARHRRERQLLSPWFTAQRVRRYGSAIQEITHRHTDGWRPGQHVRAYNVMLDISLDVILRVIFGTERGDVMEQGRRALKKLLHTVHPLIWFDPAFQAWWFPPWLRYRRAKQEFARFVTRCLAERRRGEGGSEDVLGVMLAAREGDRPFWSDDEIRDELATILLSGHETTAVALSWAFYELARHPAVLGRLRDELDALGPEPGPDLIAKQSYLGAVCNETLRLHTILMEIARISRFPCELMGHELPAGVGVGVGISAIHQDPLLYPDPDEFRPERFLAREYSAFEFLPFGGGHRRCLGAALSDYEMRIALATIVAGWEFEITGEDKEPRHNIGTGPKYGVRMRIVRRRGIAKPDPAALHRSLSESTADA